MKSFPNCKVSFPIDAIDEAPEAYPYTGRHVFDDSIVKFPLASEATVVAPEPDMWNVPSSPLELSSNLKYGFANADDTRPEDAPITILYVVLTYDEETVRTPAEIPNDIFVPECILYAVCPS